MKAITQERYGPPMEVLELREIADPVPKAKEVLIKVKSASVHPGDWLLSRGLPYLFRPFFGLRKPRKRTPGFDLAGTVVSVGAKVTDFAPGDEVFGQGKYGSCAELAATPASQLAKRPGSLSIDETAALVVSGTTALRAMRDQGKVKPGDKVLINGASGGVGSFAVQIAASLGAEVTGVCGTANLELVRSLGADHVIDYTTTDVTLGDDRYDVIIDNAGSHPMSAFRKILTPTGKVFPNNGTAGSTWVGPLASIIKASFVSIFNKRQGRPFVAVPKRQDLIDLAALVESGALSSVISGKHSLAETPKLMEQLGTGHATGKVLIQISE